MSSQWYFYVTSLDEKRSSCCFVWWCRIVHHRYPLAKHSDLDWQGGCFTRLYRYEAVEAVSRCEYL